MNLLEIIDCLEARADNARALDMSKYMKNKFEFFGVGASVRNEIWKPYFKEAKKTKKIDWDFIEICFKHDKRECQYTAAYYLKYMKKFLVEDDIPKLKELVLTKSWWDTVDILDKVIGSIIYNNKNLYPIILEWSKDDNIWLRRVAIDHQLLRKENTDEQLLEKILINNLNHKEFFVNKAIGWALRDYSKTNPQWVRNFIEVHKENMASLSIREASKYL
ncbi:DNA alkylation repair protein [Gemella morbillorum]|uniref:DNA alkylation repair protein n=1 Tax=Gemella morbillorum TaxID=29391 RepID=UPI001CB2B184|nr:DNA alkylation repair protein [Gemella morbillorum]MBF1212335.1 DNA alkylation repair protein [Gemella morbillorum]